MNETITTEDELFVIPRTQLTDILDILSNLPYRDVHVPMVILEQLKILRIEEEPEKDDDMDN